MATKVIYFTVDGCNEQAEFRSDDPPDDVKETFRSAAEAGPNDILKLYNAKGNLINISPRIPDNTPDTRYTLDVVAAQCPAEQLGFDIGAIEKRLQALEKRVFIENGDLPSSVLSIHTKVEEFKNKLQGVEHLSWLGLFKDISSGTSLQPFWDKKSLQRDTDHDKHIYDKYIRMSQVQITDEVRQYLRKPTFDNWQWDEPEMLVLLQQMYIDLGFLTKFNIELPILQNWLFEIYRNYNPVPFHNFKHCFMVTQMMYGLTWLVDLPSMVDDIDVLILLTSAICHDLGHPGYNNAYQINAKTELALRYNDISPLENHHCSIAFEILEKPNCNILANLTKDQYRRVREGMIKCILATDMAKHNEIVNNFKALLDVFDVNNKEHKYLLMMILMKVSDISNEARPMDVATPWLDCLLQEFFNQLLMILLKTADISNEVRPLEVAEPWIECLLEEFFIQSDIEKLEGLPVAPFMDREKVTKSSSQIGFIKYVLLPLFEALGQLLPVIEKDIIGPVRNALDYYTQMQKAMEEEKERNASNEKSKQNGLTNKVKGDIKV
ncbi:high affinity cGMP-specific 3',5'-cyclic phosphodiesterase 9A-like isoform X2 [Dreissena polymorpha]|uniref:high affinity cGMP-specific 3',5'-cyclic phosphodiesterase 9A-like isoform X2 n=1 Tax=Dreissena polymorpha TaxID=45954 RepID=UPI002263BB8C|nr:high affinity cGMP-specific 3',5'-cyclic phosphodiesterase 9A-like isoform X2 [Dreissena polymorpha]